MMYIYKYECERCGKGFDNLYPVLYCKPCWEALNKETPGQEALF